jgi:hypothetical protein
MISPTCPHTTTEPHPRIKGLDRCANCKEHMRDEREERLPRWARVAMDDLRRQLADAKSSARAARLDTDPAASTAVLDPYADVPIGLGKARVRFLVPNSTAAARSERWVDVNVTRDGKAIEVMTGRMMAVRPQSGNVVMIEVCDW